jgi:hypothetical protein
MCMNVRPKPIGYRNGRPNIQAQSTPRRSIHPESIPIANATPIGQVNDGDEPLSAALSQGDQLRAGGAEPMATQPLIPVTTTDDSEDCSTSADELAQAQMECRRLGIPAQFAMNLIP